MVAVAVAAALVVGGPAGATAIRTAAGDVVTTVDFEAYPVGTQITNQYSGITFEYATSAGFNLGTPGTGVASSDTAAPPVVTPYGAHGGSNAGQLISPGEFGAAGTFAVLSSPADAVSVYVGDLGGTGAHFELDAYDTNKDLLPSETSAAAVTASAGAQTFLTYSTGGTGDIAYVAIYRTDHSGGDGVMDDLSFSVPAAAPAVVGVAPSAPGYELGQGGTRAVVLTVTRFNNAANPVTVAVSGLPGGVTSSLSANPVSLPATTTSLTLTASTNVAPGNYTVSLTATASGATSQAPTTFTLSVIVPVVVAAQTQLPVGDCSSNHTAITAQVAPGEPGPVSFTVSTSSAEAGLTASLNPTSAAISNSTASSTLTISATGGSDPATVTVTATLPDGASGAAAINVQRVGPEVLSVSAIEQTGSGGTVAGLAVSTPRAGSPGSTVEILGENFCTTASVDFGNAEATDSQVPVGHTLGAQGPEDYLRVETPRYATSGPVTVTAGSPPASSTSTAALTVDSYRNAEAFNFLNFTPQLNFQDLTDAFGSQQTYINVNPCGIFTLGLANCSVPVVPDPVALAWLGIAQASAQTGTCFGIALTDQRLLSGEIAISSLPRTGPLIFDLDAPNVGSDDTARGSEPLLEVLKAQHLQQFSTEFMSSYLGQYEADQLSSPAQAVAGMVTEIRHIFAAGRYPMIELHDTNSGGGGHVVVAYDLVVHGNGDIDIYVYDSNNPFLSSEDSDGQGHANAVSSSVIHLFQDGTWRLASTTESNGAPYQGGVGTLIVTDPASIPLHPTLATLGGAAPGLLFSSAEPIGGSGLNGRASASLAQVTGPGGKTLYTKKGSINTDRSTRLDAAPFVPFVGRTGPSGDAPQLTVLGPDVRTISLATKANSRGRTVETFVNGGFVGTVSTAPQKGGTGQFSFSAPDGSVGYSGASTAPLTLGVDRVSAAGSESVALSTSATKGGSDALELGAGSGAIAISHTGPPVTFTLSAASEPRNGAPATFVSGPISIGPGQVAHISGVRWTSLSGAELTVKVGGRTIKLHNRAPSVRLLNTGTVRVLTVKHKIHLVVTGSVSKVGKGSNVAVVWVVRDGTRVVARHEVALIAQHGRFSATWAPALAKSKKLTCTVAVIAVRTAGGTASSSVTKSVTFAVG